MLSIRHNSHPKPVNRFLLLLLTLATVQLLLAGCGMFNASGQVGPDLKPHFGTSVSVPLGK
jgi:hypothetical protein